MKDNFWVVCPKIFNNFAKLGLYPGRPGVGGFWLF